MASRFFVGAATNWSSTLSWATTSGGVPGASVPDATTDVILDANSPGNLTIDVAASCLTLDCTGFTHTLTTNAVAVTVSGTLFRLVAGMTYTANVSSSLRLAATAAGTVAITTAGKTVPGVTAGYNAPSSATFQLQDNVACGSSNFVHNAGTCDLNGKNLTCAGFFSNSGAVRTLLLGSGTITMSNWTLTTAGLTFDAGTSTIVYQSSNFAGGGATYNVVTMTGSNPTITGANTFASLTWTPPASTSATLVISGANQTVTGTLTLTANSIANRALVNSETFGTARTLTAAVVSISFMDFQDITGAGAAAPFTGTSLGDCQGNAGITFTPAVTRYAKTAGSWNATATWSATSGGAAGASSPLPQDTVIMDANAGAGTYSGNLPRLCKDLICTGFTRTLSISSDWVFGSLTLCPGMTFPASSVVMRGRGACTLTSAGFSLTNLTVFTGTYTLTDATVVTSTMAVTGGAVTLAGALTVNTLLLSPGSIDDGGNAVNVTSHGQSTAPSVMVMRGVWTFSGTGTIWTASGTTMTATGSTINITDVSATTKTMAFAGLTLGNVTVTGGGTGSVTIWAAAIATLTIGAPKTVIFQHAQVVTLGNLVARGSSGSVVTITSDLASSATNLHLAAGVGGVSLAWCALTDVHASSGTFWVDSNTTQLRCSGFTTGPPARTQSATQAQATSGAANVACAQGTTQGQAASVRSVVCRTPRAAQAQSVAVDLRAAVSWTVSATQAQGATTSPSVTRTARATQAQGSSTRGATARLTTVSQGQAAKIGPGAGRTVTASQGQALGVAGLAARAVTATQPQGVSYTTTTTGHSGAFVGTFTTSQAQAVGTEGAASRTLEVTQAANARRAVSVAATVAPAQAQALVISASATRMRTRTLALTQSQALAGMRGLMRVARTSQGQAVAHGPAITRVRAVSAPQAAVARRALSRAASVTAGQAGTVRLGVAYSALATQDQAVASEPLLGGMRRVGQGQAVTTTAPTVRTIVTLQRQSVRMVPSLKAGRLVCTVTSDTTLSSQVGLPEMAVVTELPEMTVLAEV